jgi:hypothetical protein
MWDRVKSTMPNPAEIDTISHDAGKNLSMLAERLPRHLRENHCPNKPLQNNFVAGH